MTRAEQAWRLTDDHWQPYRQYKSESPACERLLQDIRDLHQIRLPVAAIELIGHELRQAYQAALETSECAHCGIRCDETDKCSKCNQRKDITEMDMTAGVCNDCIEADEELEDDDTD
jgi:hypothetical protein